MAVTIVPDLTLLCDGSAAQDAYWTGENGYSTEIFQQGTSSQAWLVSKEAVEVATFNYYAANSNTAANMSAAGTHVYLHLRCDIAPFLDYIKFRLVDGSGNYSEWNIVDHTSTFEWYGEWKTFVLNLATTPDATSGTLNLADVRTLYFTVDNSNSGNIRSIENTYIDVVRFGTGITCYDDSGTPFNFADIEAISNNTANKYGIIEEISGVQYVRGRITIGDDSANNYDANFVSNDETVVFLKAATSGESIADDLLGITLQGTATGTTTMRLGTSLGTGNALTGRNGTTIMGEDESVIINLVLPTSNIDSIDFYGSTFRRTNATIDLSGVGEVGGCTFDGCDQVSIGTATIRNSLFLNTVASSSEGAIALDGSVAYDLRNCLFANNAVAIEVVDVPTGDFTVAGLDFTGNTYDVRYDFTVDRDWNWSDSASGPTIQNVGTGTLTAVNTVDLSITSITTTARVYIEALAGGPASEGTVIANEIPGTTSWSDTYAYVSDQPVLVRVRDASVPGSEKKTFEVETVITSTGLSVVAILLDDT